MNTQATAMPATEQAIPEFGSGRYSDVMRTCYNQSQKLFGLSDKSAEAFARNCATKLGVELKNAKVEVKVGKSSKDGKVSMSEAAKVKNVTGSPELSLLHAIQWIAEAGKHGVSYGNTEWKLNEPLTEYVTSLELDN